MPTSLAHLPPEILAQITGLLSDSVVLILLPTCGDSQLMAKMSAGGVTELRFTLPRVTQRTLDVIRSLVGLQTFTLAVDHPHTTLVNLIRVLSPNLLHFSNRSGYPWTQALILLGETEFDETLFPLVNPTQRCWKVYKSFPKLQTIDLNEAYAESMLQRELGPGFMIEFFCGLPATLTHLDMTFPSQSVCDVWDILPPHVTRLPEDVSESTVIPRSLIDSFRDLYVRFERVRDDMSNDQSEPFCKPKEKAAGTLENYSFPPHLGKLRLKTKPSDRIPDYADNLILPPCLTRLEWDTKICIHALVVISALPDTITSFTHSTDYEDDSPLPKLPNRALKLRPKLLLTHFMWHNSMAMSDAEWSSLAPQIMLLIPNIEKAILRFATGLPLRAEHFALLSNSRPLRSLSAYIDETDFASRIDTSYPLHDILPNLVDLYIENQDPQSFANFSFASLPASLTKLRFPYFSTATLDMRPPGLTEINCDALEVHDYETVFVPPPGWRPSVLPSPAEVWDDHNLRLDHYPCKRSNDGHSISDDTSVDPHQHPTSSVDHHSNSPKLTIPGGYSLRPPGAPRWPSTLTSLALYSISSWNLDYLTPEHLPMLKELEIRGLLLDSIRIEGFTTLEEFTAPVISPKHQGSLPPNLRTLKLLQSSFFPKSFLPLPKSIETLHLGRVLMAPELLQTLPRLMSLRIRMAKQGKYDSWKNLSASLTSVTLLDEPDCVDYAKILMEAFPALEEIVLLHDTQVTLATLESLLLQGGGSVKLIGGCAPHGDWGNAIFIPHRTGCAQRSIVLDPASTVCDWLKWNATRAYPFWKPKEAFYRPHSIKVPSLMSILPYLSDSITDLNLNRFDPPFQCDFASLLPRGLTSLFVPSIEAPQYSATIGLPEGLKTLDIDTTGFGLIDYHCLPRGITNLTLRSQKKFTAAYSAALPQGLVSLTLSAINISDEALRNLPSSLVALTLLKQGIFERLLNAIPGHIKYIDSELFYESHSTPAHLVEIAMKRGILWIGPRRGVPLIFQQVGVDAALKKLLEHRNPA